MARITWAPHPPEDPRRRRRKRGRMARGWGHHSCHCPRCALIVQGQTLSRSRGPGVACESVLPCGPPTPQGVPVPSHLCVSRTGGRRRDTLPARSASLSNAACTTITRGRSADPRRPRECHFRAPAPRSPRRVASHRRGRIAGPVIYAAQGRPGEFATLEDWLPAKALVAWPAEA
jgi:hypothetical protein